MQDSVTVLPIESIDESRFLDFLGQDKILHVFTLYDLGHMRDKTKVWVALEGNEICGYLFEFNRKIVHTHGTVDSVAKLLDYIRPDEPTLVVEPKHLHVLKRIFKPTEATDEASQTRITTYLIMKLDVDAFKPLIKHHVKKLQADDCSEVLKHLGEKWGKRVDDLIRRGGIAFGAFEDGCLAALATVSEFVDDIALIRGVYTPPSMRNRGLATSASSALVDELTRLGKKPILWVAKDNLPARRVYEKIGFHKTEHTLLGFKAKKI